MPNVIDHQYSTARSVAKVIAGIGWGLVALGILLLVILIGETGSLERLFSGMASSIAAAMCLLVGVLGLLLVAAGQVMEAVVDNASTTHNIFSLVEKTAKELREREAPEHESQERRPAKSVRETIELPGTNNT